MSACSFYVVRLEMWAEVLRVIFFYFIFAQLHLFSFFFVFFLLMKRNILSTQLFWQHSSTVKLALVASFLKQATCIKQVCIRFPETANILKFTCFKQAPIFSKHILIVTLVLV